MYKFAYIALIGRPNAGKSTLVNRLIGEKVAIVSEKPQTTRTNTLGILNSENYQLVFVDTPGVHHSKNQLDKVMMKNVRSALAGVDIILYLFDGSKPMDSEERLYIEKLRGEGTPMFLVRTKADKKEAADLPRADLSISAATGDNLDVLIEKILAECNASETPQFIYPTDQYTDKSIRFLIAEQLREEALRRYRQEIPHGIAVVITVFSERADLVVIEADIICEAERHKGIIIGKAGINLKEMGQAVRSFCESLLGKKVLLKLFVKVEPNWRDNRMQLQDLGYDV